MALDPDNPALKLWQALVSRGVSEEEATDLMNNYSAQCIANRYRPDENAVSADTKPQ
ncbi:MULTISPECIES: hypothetical protein [Streptomyces]|uniref:hypothetical protein n=1 Tax=Streptomyces TaxID=1883 RepID=UPI000A7AFF14|nr:MULTISPECIES: hypothetical protein [unclassified Streptomyces]WST53933.1 hypothetical protein OG475_14150 [Streptomyces rubiginosohelvolus]